jgi:peptidylprolyl isomerase
MKTKVVVLLLSISLLGGCNCFSNKDVVIDKTNKSVMADKTKKEVTVAQAKSGDTVKINYTGKLTDGTVFDTSKDREPLQFTIGSKHVIPGFEEGVVGMNVGEKKIINIPCDKAYGEYRKELTQEVERKQMPADLDPKVGQRLQVKQENGQPLVVMITAVTEEKVTIDANHPLAGKNLVFDIELVEIT